MTFNLINKWQRRSAIIGLLSLPLTHYATIVVAAAVLCLPCLIWGLPPGADAPLHVIYQYLFSEQFWHGDYYPRWLTDANKGLGSPVFFLQYPLPYFATALLRALIWFPLGRRTEAHELGIFLFLVIATAGFAGRIWFRRYCSARASTLAAIVYMSLPYVLPEGVYARAALGEISAFVWMPLALAICDSFLPNVVLIGLLGVVLAGLLLSNAIVAVLFFPMLILYAVFRDPLTLEAAAKRFALTFGGLAAAVGIGAIYLFPLIAFRPLFDWSQMPVNLPGYEFARYFLFFSADSFRASPTAPLAVYGLDPVIGVALCGSIVLAMLSLAHIWRGSLNRSTCLCLSTVLCAALLSTVPNLGAMAIHASGLTLSNIGPSETFTERAFLVSLCTLGLGVLAYCSVADVGARRDRVLIGIASGAMFLMLPWSAPIWKAFPVLTSIQYPFRLGSVLSLAVAGLVASAIDRCTSTMPAEHGLLSQRLLVAALVWTIGAGFVTWRVDWNFRLAFGVPDKGRANAEASTRYDPTRAIDIPYRTYVAPQNAEAFARRVSTTLGDGFANARSSPFEGPMAECLDGSRRGPMIRLGSRELIGVVDCPGNGHVQVNQVYWPLWKVLEKDGSAAGAEIARSAEGLLEISLPPGRQTLHLVLEQARSEYWGELVTAISIMIIIGSCIVTVIGARKSLIN
jgi:hypothetical protein